MAGRTAVTVVVVMEEMDTVVSPMVNVLDVSKFEPLMVNVSPPVRKILDFKIIGENIIRKTSDFMSINKCLPSITSALKSSCVQ